MTTRHADDETLKYISELEAYNKTRTDELAGAAQRIATLEQQVAELVAALEDWDSLIQYQYSGSREAMSAMQQCAFDTKDILDKVKP